MARILWGREEREGRSICKGVLRESLWSTKVWRRASRPVGLVPEARGRGFVGAMLAWLVVARL